ncbi:hypothetical protein Tco_0273749 [Tanacetum coccineum]
MLRLLMIRNKILMVAVCVHFWICSYIAIMVLEISSIAATGLCMELWFVYILRVLAALKCSLDIDGDSITKNSMFDGRRFMRGYLIKGKLGSFVSFREMITSQLQGKLWLYDEVRIVVGSVVVGGDGVVKDECLNLECHSEELVLLYSMVDGVGKLRTVGERKYRPTQRVPLTPDSVDSAADPFLQIHDHHCSMERFEGLKRKLVPLHSCPITMLTFGG